MKYLLLTLLLVTGCASQERSFRDMFRMNQECPPTALIGFDKEMNSDERKSLKTAKISCRSKYKKCLKSFEKKRDRTFYAICGGDLVSSKDGN